MPWEDYLARSFGLDDNGWVRHANPASGWSRLATGLPLIILAAWSRVWMGWWAAALFLLVVVWLWLSPRLFAPTTDDTAWMSRAVPGERLWTRRRDFRLPEAETVLPHAFNALAGLSSLVLIFGLVVLYPAATALGAVGTFFFKFGFVHRMAVLYDRASARDRSLVHRRAE